MTARPTIIKSRRVQLETVRRVPTAAQFGSTSQNDCEVEKAVRAVSANGRVQAIELTCSCGERTLIELDYDSSAPEAPTQ